ncbi:MAG: acetate/propionate family kinase, partial [Lachnospiraceae bacterium]|nr:acetate/propionate family kinase [Lachnospiraceae bacterium]
PMVGVFDTAFHQSMPEKAYMYGIPYSFYEKYRIRKYGFHGTSHSYVSKRVCEVAGRDLAKTKTIVCHLGNGSSICAVDGGKSVDTSMGLSPLEGLMMGTRCGELDPSVVEFIANKEGLDVSGVLQILNKKSGVEGISGVSSDFRDLWAAANEGNEKAKLALDMFCYKVAKFIGSYAAVLNGVDLIAFTAGVGENDTAVREKVCEYLTYLGITLDKEANNVHGEEKRISTDDSKIEVYVIPTNEELAIARETVALVK